MTELRPGWLRRQLDEAAREVASWPEWKRQLVKKCFNAPTDPRWTCRYQHHCREAQSCNGKACEDVAWTTTPAVSPASK